MRQFGIKAVAGISLLALAACGGGDGEMVESEYEPGFQMLASQNYTGAEAFFAAEIADDPDDAYAHLNLGAAHEAQGNYAMAREHYQAAIAAGEGEPVGKTVYNGQVKIEDTTVAAVAAYNMSNLPQ